MYENKIPAWVINNEGRVILNSIGTAYCKEVYLKDHLGNVRVACRLENGVLKTRQVDSYYPFGMNIKGLTANSTVGIRPNEYLYNGKMMQDEMGLGWLDYGARFYDPVLGRWHSLDPLCEISRRWSPYSYVYNNPSRFTDPEGMKPFDLPDKKSDAFGFETEEEPKNWWRRYMESKNEHIDYIAGHDESKAKDPNQKEPTSKKKKNFTMVISLGIQGGIKINTIFGSLSLFGNLGSIDLIGVRNNKFVFCKGSRRGISVTAGPLTIVEIEGVKVSTPLYLTSTEIETTTTIGAGTKTTTLNYETVEKQTINELDPYNSPPPVVQSKKVINKTSYGIKVGAIIVFDISRETSSESENLNK